MANSEKIEKSSRRNKKIEVRFMIKADKESELYDIFEEMREYLSPIKPSEVTKFLINKAYTYWYLNEIKKEDEG